LRREGGRVGLSEGLRSRSEIGKAWKEYKSKRCVVKKIIRQKKEEDRAGMLRFIQENGGTQCKLFWSDLKRQGKKRSWCIMKIKNHEGVLLTDPEEVKERLRKYWEELGESVGAARHTEQEDPGVEMEVKAMIGNVDRISKEEILYALRNLERGKAAGPDGILNEMLMFRGEKMISSMRVLFNNFTELEEYPQQWRRSLIVPMFKDGDREELDNYRGIALSCTVGKVFERVLDERIRRNGDEGSPGRVQERKRMCRSDLRAEKCGGVKEEARA